MTESPDARLLDKALPLQARIDAAQLLSRQSSDYTAWKTLCTVVHAEDEDILLRCATLRALPHWNPSAALDQLTRAYRAPELRRAAIETLESLTPVTGEHAVLLSLHLSTLRGTLTEAEIESAQAQLTGKLAALLSMELTLLRTPSEDRRRTRVAGLPQRWGRDRRVLAFLEEELQQQAELRRADAVQALCVLGELQPAFEATNDPSATVRARLAETLGFYREPGGVETLQQLLNDSSPEVVRQTKSALRLIGKLAMPARLPERQRNSEWGRLLAEISRLRLADPDVAARVQDHKVTANWLGEPPATEPLIAAAERRIGAHLPPTYRAFLLEANGFEEQGTFIWKLYGTSEIDWFRTLNPDWVEAYQSLEGDRSIEEHLADPADSLTFRSAYLSSCLQISEVGDSAVVLLNPEAVTPAGEWETWFFANWLPGATRYPSFRQFMEAELAQIVSLAARP